MTPSSENTRLLVLPDGAGTLDGHVLASPADQLTGPAVFTVNGRGGLARDVVRVVADTRVPQGDLIVAEATAEVLGLTPGSPWRLDTRSSTPLATVTLESVVEAETDQLLAAIQEARLGGTLLWVDGSGGAATLDLGSHQLRVIALDEGVSGVGEIVAGTTTIHLHVSSARTGLDIVILADRSGSMDVPDLPVESVENPSSFWGRSSQTYQTRLEALKAALRSLLEARLRIGGRESRLAVLGFNHGTRQIFPTSPGMMVLDATSPQHVVEQFEQSVSRLVADGGTNIGQALLDAAALLEEHGRYDNDRLIVLVSDGRPWTASSNDATGEIVVGADDPVSLVSHLNQSRRIRLHAIGISDNNLYEAWRRRTNHPGAENLRPDHPLLERLVEVGGGDPTRIGGIEVLEQYFHGLGGGITRKAVKVERAAPVPRVLDEDLQAVVATAAQSDPSRLDELVTSFEANMHELNTYAAQILGLKLGKWVPFDKMAGYMAPKDREILTGLVKSSDDFGTVMKTIHKAVCESGPRRILRAASGVAKEAPPKKLVEIFSCFQESGERINTLRNFHLHNKSSFSTGALKESQDLATILRHYVGTVHIEHDDAVLWDRLRAAVLEDVRMAIEGAMAVARPMAASTETQSSDETNGVVAGSGTTTDLRYRL